MVNKSLKRARTLTRLAVVVISLTAVAKLQLVDSLYPALIGTYLTIFQLAGICYYAFLRQEFIGWDPSRLLTKHKAVKAGFGWVFGLLTLYWAVSAILR